MQGGKGLVSLSPFFLVREDFGKVQQSQYLAGFMALLYAFAGIDISPTKEIVTPEGLKMIPASASGAGAQVAQGSEGALNVVFRVLKSDVRKAAVYYARRAAAGTWSEPVQISDEGADCEDPVIGVCSDGTLVSSWIDTTARDGFTLVIRSSGDSGRSWSSAVRQPAGITRAQPQIAVSGRAVYLCFTGAVEKNGADRVFLFQSHDAGSSWSQKEVDSKRAGSLSSQVRVMARADQICLAWCHQDATGFSVVANGSTDGGETWLSEPVVVSDPRPEKPSDPMFDVTDTQVVLVWKATYSGSKAIIYEDRSEDGITWGRDRILLESRVIPVTYRIVRLGNDRLLLWLGVQNLRPERKAICWIRITYTSEATPNQEVVGLSGGEQATVSEFDVKVIDEVLYLAAIARFGKGDWRVLLLSRKADGENRRWILGGEDRKERLSLALVPLGQTVGWLFHERRARMLPMESSLSERLVFGRLEQNH